MTKPFSPGWFGEIQAKPLISLVLLVLVLTCARPTVAHDCERLGITGETLEALEAYLERATTTIDVGVLVGGGLATALREDGGGEVSGLFHMAISGGKTYAIGMDIERYCNDPEAPMPPGLGWQLFVATNDFEDIELGGLLRFHGELDLLSPGILLELGGFHRWAVDESGLGALLSVGYGTQIIQILGQGQLIFQDALQLVAFIGFRLDAYLFRLVL